MVTRLVAYFAGFSASDAGVIQSADCQHLPRVLICLNFQTTERKARLKKNSAMPSTLTRDLNSRESASNGKNWSESKQHLAALGILVVSMDYGTKKSRAEVTLKGNCNTMKTELRRWKSREIKSNTSRSSLIEYKISVLILPQIPWILYYSLAKDANYTLTDESCYASLKTRGSGSDLSWLTKE